MARTKVLFLLIVACQRKSLGIATIRGTIYFIIIIKLLHYYTLHTPNSFDVFDKSIFLCSFVLYSKSTKNVKYKKKKILKFIIRMKSVN